MAYSEFLPDDFLMLNRLVTQTNSRQRQARYVKTLLDQCYKGAAGQRVNLDPTLFEDLWSRYPMVLQGASFHQRLDELVIAALNRYRDDDGLLLPKPPAWSDPALRIQFKQMVRQVTSCMEDRLNRLLGWPLARVVFLGWTGAGEILLLLI